MKFEDLKEHENEQIELDGDTFVFHIVSDMSGEWATFQGKKHNIYATLNFVERGIPFEMSLIDDAEPIFQTQYEGEVSNWKNYVSLVNRMYKKAKKERIIGRFD